MESTESVVEKVKELVAPLGAQERLRVIQAIEEMDWNGEGDTVRKNAIQQPDTLAEEQAAWFALPPEVRKQYQGEFVAIHEGNVIDHNRDVRALHGRIRERFGRTPIPILNADWDEPPVYVFRSPRRKR